MIARNTGSRHVVHARYLDPEHDSKFMEILAQVPRTPIFGQIQSSWERIGSLMPESPWQSSSNESISNLFDRQSRVQYTGNHISQHRK
jgi:hypothetical protein